MNLKVLYLRVCQNCNAKCFMCDFWKNTKNEIRDDQFECILKMMPSGTMIRFTGGEPLLCKQLSCYIQKCHAKGINVSVITNGLLLDEKLDSLMESGLDQIVISVDGSTPELHNGLRGIQGLHEKIEKTLERISKQYPTLHTRVNTVVSEKNIQNLSGLVTWLEKYHVQQWSIIPIKQDRHRWSDKISYQDFERGYREFQRAIANSHITLMGYSATWAGDTESFWSGNHRISPKGACYLTRRVSFYDPFKDRFYPCNCIPHRSMPFKSRDEEIAWYFEHGHTYCKGCEPLNAYCSDFPEEVDKYIFNY